MQSLTCIRVSTKTQLDDALAVRWSVFGDEMGLVRAASGREGDEWDTLETTIHWVAYCDDLPIATIRLLLPNPLAATLGGHRLGLPIEDQFDLSEVTCGGGSVSLAQAGRLCVLPRWRRSRALHCLFGRMYRESRSFRVTHWLGAVNCDTDDPEDAAILYRVLRARGLVSERWRSKLPRGSGSDRPISRPFYSAAARACASAGDLDGLRLPPNVSLNVRKLGARGLGAPAMDHRFGMFSIPMVIDLDDVPPETVGLEAPEARDARDQLQEVAP